MSSAQAQPEAGERIPEDLKGHEEITCKLAGVSDVKALLTLLQAWDYTKTANAGIAYKDNGIERLQLLRQIKPLLFDGMGFSRELFDKLEFRRGVEARALAEAQGISLQPWSGLGQSTDLRNFVDKHSHFFGGRVAQDKKWYFSQSTQFTPPPASNEVAAISAPEFLMPTYLDTMQHSVIGKEHDDFSKYVPHGNNAPNKTEHKTSQYQRDSELKNWILQNANGICECCNQGAPFIADDGHPYLEIHHVVRLADGGSDTISNTVAVCPNCHRELHYGAKARELALRLCKNIDRLPHDLLRLLPKVATDGSA